MKPNIIIAAACWGKSSSLWSFFR